MAALPARQPASGTQVVDGPGARTELMRPVTLRCSQVFSRPDLPRSLPRNRRSVPAAAVVTEIYRRSARLAAAAPTAMGDERVVCTPKRGSKPPSHPLRCSAARLPWPRGHGGARPTWREICPQRRWPAAGPAPGAARRGRPRPTCRAPRPFPRRTSRTAPAAPGAGAGGPAAGPVAP